MLCSATNGYAQQMTSASTIPASAISGKEQKIADGISFIGKLKKKQPEGIGMLIYYSPDGKQSVKLSGDFYTYSSEVINVTKGQLLFVNHNLTTYGTFNIDMKSLWKISVQGESIQRIETLTLPPLFKLEQVSIRNDKGYDIHLKENNNQRIPVKVSCKECNSLIPSLKLNQGFNGEGTSLNGLLWDLRIQSGKETYCFDIFKKPDPLYAIGYADGAVYFHKDVNSNSTVIEKFNKKWNNKELSGTFKDYVANGWNGTQNAAQFEGFLKVGDRIAKEGTFLLPMPSENSIYTFFNDVFVSVNPQFTKLSTDNIKSYSIVCEEPGTILNHIPLQDIGMVDSLTVTGILDVRDVNIIDKMKNLSYLDLSDTYITYDPERKKEIQTQNGVYSLIGQLLTQAVEDEYSDGNISSLSYRINKPLAQALANCNSVDPQTDICFMPTVSDMPLLETVKLPKLATFIAALGFSNCPSLQNIEWPLVLEDIGAGCFANCKSLKKLTFPSSLRDISGEEIEDLTSFYGCDAVEIIDMSNIDNFNQEYYFRFGGLLRNLKEMRFPKNMKTIKFMMFGDQLIHFYVPDSPEVLDINITKPTRKKDVISKGSVPTGKGIIHFASPTPPSSGFCRADVMYIPKGSITSYYTKYGDKVKYIEE